MGVGTLDRLLTDTSLRLSTVAWGNLEEVYRILRHALAEAYRIGLDQGLAEQRSSGVIDPRENG